jgi:type IV pilus assembly protein PilB
VVLETAAGVLDHPRVTVVDEQATLNLFDSLKESHSAYWMGAIASRGALPVDSDLDASTGRLRVTFATSDPSDPDLGGMAEKLGVNPEFVYAPASVMDPLLETLVGDRPPPEEDPDEPDPGDESVDAEDDAGPFDSGAEHDRVTTDLLRDGLVTRAQVAEAVSRLDGGSTRGGVWRMLASMDGVDGEKVYAHVAAAHSFRLEKIKAGRPDTDFSHLILETMTPEQRRRMIELNLLPFDYEIDDRSGDPTLVFVTHDPTRAEAHHLLGRLNAGRFELRYAPEKSVARVLSRLGPIAAEPAVPRPAPVRTYDIAPTLEDAPKPVAERRRSAADGDKAIDALFEQLLVEAVRAGASDIHMYPDAGRQLEIHFRVDGRLRPFKREGQLSADRFMASIREKAGIKADPERVGPMEGHLQRRIEDSPVRFRVSMLPMTTGNGGPRTESIVIRIMDSRSVPTDLRRLGLGPDTRKKLERAVAKSQGMVITTGPAGSGRSTTMAAALHTVLSPEVSTLSIEDPVDYVRDGVRHVQLDRRTDLEGALRAVLRHDPDVVLVGEIRDRVSAGLAVKLANTGHLVFSILQAPDATSAVSALLRLGVEPFQVAYAVNLIVAQRLVREVCAECSVTDDRRDPVLMRRLGFSDKEILSEAIRRASPGSACSQCAGRGYRGRRVVSEALYFSTPVRHLVTEAGSALDEETLRSVAAEEGMTTLAESYRALVLEGATTIEEVMRVMTV